MGVVERVRNTDPQTSWDAAAVVDLPGSQAVVFDILTRGPLTHEAIWDSQIVHAINTGREVTTYSPSRIRTATHELVKAGLVRQAGTVVNARGRHETLWALTEKAA